MSHRLCFYMRWVIVYGKNSYMSWGFFWRPWAHWLWSHRRCMHRRWIQRRWTYRENNGDRGLHCKAIGKNPLHIGMKTLYKKNTSARFWRRNYAIQKHLDPGWKEEQGTGETRTEYLTKRNLYNVIKRERIKKHSKCFRWTEECVEIF
jgi:hypothetical protein